uniref:Cnn_1N domain-containing protein n=1 Tax=Heterorhabditis bacteriophora TaxID=37862 RepID=A0A1I7WVY0_HETBA
MAHLAFVVMTWLPLLLLTLFVYVSSNPVFSKREIAPSLVLDRIYLLRHSIEKLQQMNHKIRCQIKELEGSRSKRIVGPAQRLDELISPLSLVTAEEEESHC